MGRRNYSNKNTALWDSEDDDSSVISEQLVGFIEEETEFNKDTLLDNALDDLYEKRGSTREKALSSIINAFSINLHHEFLEKNHTTLLDRCLNSIKRGSIKEVTLACHVVGLLALAAGDDKIAQEILDESIIPISEALHPELESSKIVSLVNCLAIISFVAAQPEGREKAMQIMWQQVHPKLLSKAGDVTPSPTTITAVVSAWSFLLSTMEGATLTSKYWQESIYYLSSLLDKDERAVRIAAGEALAVIIEMGCFEKFSKVVGNSEEQFHVQGLKGKVVDQMLSLSVEAGGKGTAKKDRNSQRNLFKDVLGFLEDGYCPKSSVQIGCSKISTSTWSQLIQLNFLRHFLGGGFVPHMFENEFLHIVLGFKPQKKVVGGHLKSKVERRMFKSPNSSRSKARTQQMNKQRRCASMDISLFHVTS